MKGKGGKRMEKREEVAPEEEDRVLGLDAMRQPCQARANHISSILGYRAYLCTTSTGKDDHSTSKISFAAFSCADLLRISLGTIIEFTLAL